MIPGGGNHAGHAGAQQVAGYPGMGGHGGFQSMQYQHSQPGPPQGMGGVSPAWMGGGAPGGVGQPTGDMMQRRMQETMLQSRMGLPPGQGDPSLGKRHAIDFLVSSGAGSGPGAGGSDAGAHAVNAPGKEPADKRPRM
jgi:hypothetical protein